MQQKRGKSRFGLFVAVLAVLIIGAGIVLMTRDIPAPQQPVEKSLDAKTILEQKP